MEITQNESKMTAKDAIINRLRFSSQKLAIHEFKIDGYSENNLATRAFELHRDGKICGQFREGKNYKEYWIPIVDYEPIEGII